MSESVPATSPFDNWSDETCRSLLGRLEAMGPEELLRWAVSEHGDRAAIMTSFQNTGCVMIDMAARQSPKPRVVTVDTLRLHPETYDQIKQIEERYGIVVERFGPDPDKLRKMIARHGEYLFFDNKAKQEYCCRIRKVEPNERALETVDVWITGLRRDQSAARREAPRVEFIERLGRKVLKLAPLADWNLEMIEAYVQANEVPINPLYLQGYTSIGCIICSTPTMPWEDPRAGRWRWQKDEADSKECGIHLDGSGI